MARYVIIICALLLFEGRIIAQETPYSADAVLKEACQKAAQNNKNVMIIFHASWCGWCHKMDSSINDPACRDFFQKNYEIRHLTVYESEKNKNLENPGALDMLTRYHGNDQGIPFWLVFDKDGKLLGDSFVSPGNNSGCPAKEEEVNHLIEVLKKSSSISPQDEEAIRKRFRKNDI